MLKSLKYRLYPTKRQQRLLSAQLEKLRWLWNTLLAERKRAWEERREAVDYYEQKAELPSLKADVRPGLKQVHSQVVQDVALRLKKAFDAFFRRLKAGETPDYPRFRGKGRYDSLTYLQWENGVKLSASGKRLLLSKVGAVKLVSQRALEGTPKTAPIGRTATGKWFVTISCEWDPTPLPPTGQEVRYRCRACDLRHLLRWRGNRQPTLLSPRGAGVGEGASAAPTSAGRAQSHACQRDTACEAGASRVG